MRGVVLVEPDASFQPQVVGNGRGQLENIAPAPGVVDAMRHEQAAHWRLDRAIHPIGLQQVVGAVGVSAAAVAVAPVVIKLVGDGDLAEGGFVFGIGQPVLILVVVVGGRETVLFAIDDRVAAIDVAGVAIFGVVGLGATAVVIELLVVLGVEQGQRAGAELGHALEQVLLLVAGRVVEIAVAVGFVRVEPQRSRGAAIGAEQPGVDQGAEVVFAEGAVSAEQGNRRFGARVQRIGLDRAAKCGQTRNGG